jgi:hypothetical protein
MLSFLAPAALVGLSFLAIPIVIHLLKPRKMRRTPFSSLRWLQLTQQKLSRRLRWHQVFLFLLRAAFIAVLIAAVAKPVLDRRSGDGAATPRERFVVLDVSRSMGYRAALKEDAAESTKRETPLEAGKRAAATLLAGGGAEDRTALLTVGSSTRILGPLARGGERYAPKLSSLTAEPTGTDLGSALETIRTLTARSRPEAKIEVYIVTDRAQGSLRPEQVEAFTRELPDRVSATIVDVAPKDAANGWIADAAYLPAEGGDAAAIEVQLRAVGTVQERTIRLVGLAGREDKSRTITLDPAKPLAVTFELPPDFDGRGESCELVLDPPDGLPTDDRWYLSFDSGTPLDVLIVEGRGPGNGAAPPGFTLHTALEALSSPTKPIRAATKKFNEVEPADFAAADVVLLAGVPQLSDVVLEALTTRVQRGLGLGIFLGAEVDVDFYNRRLIDPLHREKSLLPQRLERIADVPNSSGGMLPLESVDWQHLLLAGLFDPTIGDIGQVRARSYFRFGAPADRGATVLARVGGEPFILAQSAGQGSVVLFNTSADDSWSDLARRKSFVPLVDRLLNQLSGGATRGTFRTGEAIALAVAPLAAGESLRVVGPGGDELAPALRPSGNRLRVALPPQTTPGFYRIRRTGGRAIGDSRAQREVEESTFVVQVDRADSALAPISDDALRSAWQPASCEIVAAAAIASGEVGGDTSLVGWAVLLAALLLASEIFVVHKLCPRMTPPAAESIVRRKASPAAESPGEALSSALPSMVRNS